MASPIFIRIASSRSRTPAGIFSRVLAGFFTLLALVGLVMFSAVALVVVLAGGAVFLVYLWWKTRALRRALREQAAMPQAQQVFRPRQPVDEADGMVIDGEMIREVPEAEAAKV